MQKFMTILLFTSVLNFAGAQQLLFTEPQLLPTSINGQTDVDFPMFAPDGSKLFFSRTGDERNTGGKEAGGDIWFTSIVANGQWAEAVNTFSSLNNDQENAVVGINTTATRIYLYNSYLKASPSKISICYSDFVNGSWTNPKLLNIGNIEVGLNPYGLFMNTTEDVLLVSVTGLEGQGEEDIYVSFKKEGGKWSKPLNLGPVINTKGYDFSPFLDHTGKNLYFASNGHGGFGGTDILVSTRLDDTWTNWSPPINLGSKINSPQDEIYFTMTNRDLAFFSSKRGAERSAFYQSRIQLIEKKEMEQKSLPVVKNPVSSDKPLTLISRVNLKTNKEALPELNVMLVDEDGTVIEKKKTGSDGTVLFTNLKSNRNYKMVLDTNVSDLDIKQFVQEKVEADPQLVYAMYDAGAWIATPNESPRMSLISKVIYKANSKEAEAQLVILMSEDGTELARAYTDEKGLVIFRQLPTDRKYKLKSDDPELSLSYAVQGEESELVKAVTTEPVPKSSTGQVVSKANDAPVSLIKLPASGSSGKASEMNLLLRVSPKDGKSLPGSIGLVIADHKGVIVFKGKTDEEGYLRVDRLKADKDYSIRLEDNSDLYNLAIAESYDESKMQKVAMNSLIAKGHYLGCINQSLVKERGKYNLICRLAPVVGSDPIVDVPLVLVDDAGLIVSKARSNQNGEVVFKALNPSVMYRLFSERPLPGTNLLAAYQFDPQAPTVTDTSSLRPNIGSSFTGHILFDYDRAVVQEQLNGPIFNKMKDMLSAYPTVKLTLIGHTDEAGEESYNLSLSKKRAEALRQFLINRYQIRPNSIKIEAKGESKPLLASTVDQNRRVELLVEGY